MATIRPMMEYGDIVWAGGNITDLNKLEMVQKSAARIVTGATARCSTDRLMEDVRWPSLSSRRRDHRLTLFYKIVNGLSRPYLNDLLPDQVGNKARYALRRSTDYIIPMCRTVSLSRSFYPSTAREWNNMEQEHKNSLSVQAFKSKLTARQPRNELFYYGPRRENIILTRMRIGCSALNAHLYYNLHVIDSACCPCGFPNENPRHYFLECPIYTANRNTLMLVLEPNTQAQDILHGVVHESPEINNARLDAIYTFIRDSRRFIAR